jgi:hypothetical protein
MGLVYDFAGNDCFFGWDWFVILRVTTLFLGSE